MSQAISRLTSGAVILPLGSALVALACTMLGACSSGNSSSSAPSAGSPGSPISPQTGQSACELVSSGFGPAGSVPIHTQAVVTGLEVPWDIAFLPGGTDWLVSERPGRLRLIRNGSLQPTPVLTVQTVSSGEGGLLGIALDPGFSGNSTFYIYFTASSGGTYVNRVQSYQLSADHTSATAGPVIFDNIPWNTVHNGGRIKFGADGMLYVSTGEGADATLPQNPASVSGKILRISSNGTIPADNPAPGQAWFLKGLRNPEAFDFWDPATIIVADNGPTGEYEGRTGGDEVDIAQKGDDLGWPSTWHCESQAGLVTPILSWTDAVPPGGLLIYQNGDIPAWDGSILIGSTGGEHLHRIVLGSAGAVASHEVYLQGTLGRLRTVLQGPQGELYVTTTNCDGRGDCPSTQDGIYRILSGSS